MQDQLGTVVFLGILLVIAVSNLLTLRRIEHYPAPAHFPRVSVLIPARNEQEVIGECVRSLLSQDYPDFEVLVLDDGSTDGTAAVLAELACQDSRLRVLSGRPLPPTWLGKQWACQQMAEQATGELLLFTDADTVHQPQALRAGVSALLAERADLMSAFVRQRLLTWGERLTVPTIFWCFFSFLPLALAHRLGAPALSLTNGQWILMRKSAYEAVGGHAAVRGSLVDDIALGRLVKAAGLRWRVVDASQRVSCRMYVSFCAAVEGFTKNLFAVFDFRLAPYLFAWLWLALVTLEPLAISGLWLLGVPWASSRLWPAAVAVAEMVLLWTIGMWRLRLPRYLALLYAVSVTVVVFIALRSLLWVATGTATWKGRTLARQGVRLL